MAEKALDIIKKALLLEYRGKAFYKSVADSTDNEGVKEIFEMMVEEEEMHAEKLAQLYKDISAGEVKTVNLDEKPKDITVNVLTDKIKKDIVASGYESAAISAAMAMEKQAVQFYAKSAKEAETEEEKKLYNWLANWEQTHEKYLADIDEEIMKDIWYDNNFWPLD